MTSKPEPTQNPYQATELAEPQAPVNPPGETRSAILLTIVAAVRAALLVPDSFSNGSFTSDATPAKMIMSAFAAVGACVAASMLRGQSRTLGHWILGISGFLCVISLLII